MKRDYRTGAHTRSVQYNVSLTSKESKELENLRSLVAKSKGRSLKDFSKADFLMWMCRRCTINFDDTGSIEDFCDSQISDLDALISRLQNICMMTKGFKERIVEEASAEEVDDDAESD